MGISVINTSFKEVDHIAASLDQRGKLDHYIRPYTFQKRRWEQLVTNTPVLGPSIALTLGRRRLPADLHSDKIVEAGKAWDLMTTLSLRIDRRLLKSGDSRLTNRLIQYRTNAIARRGARCSQHSDTVFSSWNCALEAFQQAAITGRRAVLDYPFAHHRYYQQFLQLEKGLRPDFAATLPSPRSSDEGLLERLDEECDIATRILVGSAFVRDTFVQQGIDPEKITVIPYGVDTRLFHPHEPDKPDSGPLQVLFAGGIGQRKGIAYLLDAFKQLNDPRLQLTLVGSFAGSRHPFRPYEHLFQHQEHVPYSKMLRIFSQSDLFVLPTLVEGMPLVVLEAMASGLPVIVTANGPAAVVRDGIDGFIVPSRDSDAIASRIETLRDNAELRRQMGANARARAQEFTWRHYVDQATDAVLRA